MQQTGTLRSWHDDKGFGFIAPTHGGRELFVHISAFPRDGRTHCSQMRSCEEATWFINHCPGTQMDGNDDGVPCEQQFCRAAAFN